MGDVDSDQRYASNFISMLPDEILQTILDKVPVVTAVSTGFLSHRWRDLWKYISIIEFDPSWVELTGKEITPSVNQFISLHKGLKILTFAVRFTYEPEMSSSVDSWVIFAISKHVEDLELNFDVADNNIIQNTAYAPCYKLLPIVFDCKSLVTLVLCFCDLELPMSFHLCSLKVLRLHRIELPHDAIHMITSNAPVLQQLFLSDCNRTRDLRIHVAPNPHFCDLVIIENFFPVNHATRIYINAPTAFQIAFMGSMPRSRYIVEEIAEGTEAHFSLQGMFTACGKYGINILTNDARALIYEFILQELLARLRHSYTIHMCNWSLQLLALREMRNLRRFVIDCIVLEISTAFWKWELPGIIYMLKSCNRLEELIIWLAPNDDQIQIPNDYLVQYDFDEKKFLDIQDLGLELENLRTVRFKAMHGDYQTWEDEHFSLERFFNGSLMAIEITKILRDHAVNLRSIEFVTSQQEIEIFFEDLEKDEEDDRPLIKIHLAY